MTGRLLSNIQIGPLALRNRVVLCAPGANYGGLDEHANRPTEELAAYWGYLARGGAGLLVTEAQSVHPTSTPNPRTVENSSDAIVPAYRAVSDAIHDGGARVIGHLWHAGFLGATGYRNLPLWAPSAVRAPMGAAVPNGGGAIAYAMTRADIRELTAAFAGAARRLQEARFDGVEIDAAHGFLLAEFLSPKVNVRSDEYGGSLENRCRIVVEILRAVREAVGDRFAIGLRLSADPYIEPGLTEHDLPAIARQIAGSVSADYVNVMPALLPDSSHKEGLGVETARAVREATALPVIYNGLLTDPVVAASILEREDADLVGMTRALLADPKLTAKLEAGKTDEIRACIGCNQTCSGVALATPYCLLNPTPLDVDLLSRNVQGQGRRVLVIGAGLAGLEVARLARMAGFEVSIWERSDRIGGQVNLVAGVEQRSSFARAVDFYSRQLVAWGVDVRFGQETTVETVDALNPDAVVVATGSTPAMPAWASAVDGCRVLDARAALSDGHQLGSRVVVAMAEVDRGETGMTIAEFLASRGHQVTLVSPALEPCINQEFTSSEQAYRRLLPRNVRFLTLTEVTGMKPGEVQTVNVYTRQSGTLPADSLVISHGGVANDGLFYALMSHRPNVFAAGDCVAPRDLAGAISDGMRVVEKLASVTR